MAPDQTDSGGDGDSDGTGRRNFMRGSGVALAFALAGTTPGAVAAQEGGTPIEDLLADAPKNWGRWGEDDELGALNLLGSEQAFEGMKAVTDWGEEGIERFTLQLSMTGEVINPDPDRPGVIFPPGSENGNAPEWPSTDTGDPAFPPRTPARRDNTTGEGGSANPGGVTYVDDKWATDFFLQGTTHLDALGHAWYGDRIYNGYPASSTETTKEFETPLDGTGGIDAVPEKGGGQDRLSTITETKGLAKADISQSASAGVAGRAVLLDVGRHLDAGDEKRCRLPLGYGITHQDLLDCADAQGTEIRERDILLIRTGATERTRDPEADWAPLNEPGLVYSEALVEWVADMDIPYIGSDNLAVEKVTQVIDGETYVIPLHGAFIRNLGVCLNEILDLSDLADACDDDGVYEFLFTAAPLKVERGSGAPINPVVLKATGGGQGNGGPNGNGRQ